MVMSIHHSYVSSDSALGHKGSSLTLRGSMNAISFSDNVKQTSEHNPRHPGSGKRFLYEELYPEPNNLILHDKATNGRVSVNHFQSIIIRSINRENGARAPLTTELH